MISDKLELLQGFLTDTKKSPKWIKSLLSQTGKINTCKFLLGFSFPMKSDWEIRCFLALTL